MESTDIIIYPSQVETLIEKLGMKPNEFITGTCGVKMSTFKNWSNKNRIPNETVLIMVNLIAEYPELVNDLRNIAGRVKNNRSK